MKPWPCKLLICSVFSIAFSKPLWAGPQALPIQDYGKRGHTFPIRERSLLDVIEERLKEAQASGRIEILQKKFQEKATFGILNPMPVKGIKPTEEPRVFTFDPTYTRKEDLKDHKGCILARAGAAINPLDHVPWGAPLIFIDGDDKSQVQWALEQEGEQEGKIVLVKGSPLMLQDHHKRWFYFDQGGLLVKKLGIKQVPAKVSQEGKHLKIEEVKPFEASGVGTK